MFPSSIAWKLILSFSRINNGCFIASGLVEKVCFWSNRHGVVLGEMGYSHSIWQVLTLRSQCNLPFDISDWFSRAPLQEVRGNNWISLNCAHGLLTEFSESMSAMQMFHLWHWEIMGNRDGIQIGVIIARLHHSWLWRSSGWRWQAFSVPHQNVRMPFSAPLMFSWLSYGILGKKMLLYWVVWLLLCAFT